MKSRGPSKPVEPRLEEERLRVPLKVAEDWIAYLEAELTKRGLPIVRRTER